MEEKFSVTISETGLLRAMNGVAGVILSNSSQHQPTAQVEAAVQANIKTSRNKKNG